MKDDNKQKKPDVSGIHVERMVRRGGVSHEVRQILMNELGLTRESIREEVKIIVTDTVEKFFRSGDFSKYLYSRINEQLKTYRYDDIDQFKAIIQKIALNEIKDAVKVYMKEHFKISVQCSESV